MLPLCRVGISATTSVSNLLHGHVGIFRSLQGTRVSLLMTLGDTDARAAMRAKRMARKEALAKKEADFEAYLASIEDCPSSAMDNSSAEEQAKEKQKSVDKQKRIDVETAELLLEAGAITRSLYRTCMRCVKVIRPGNEHDEAEFKAREEALINEEKSGASFGSFVLPTVDRENELSSRAQYYHHWTREQFEQESDCLSHEPLREENVDRYIYFIRLGEDRRKWLMNDYKFKDPYPASFDFERVDEFEARARKLLQEVYGARGWTLPSIIAAQNQDTGKDDFWDGDDEP